MWFGHSDQSMNESHSNGINEAEFHYGENRTMSFFVVPAFISVH